MITDSAWLSWEQLNTKGKNKKIIFFGAGYWLDKTKVYLAKDAAYIVDNSKYEQGQRGSGLNIYNPEKLLEETRDEILIIITTSGFMEVSEQLINYGFVSGEHFIVTPSLKDFATIARINQNKQEVYITCSDQYLDNQSNRGGGLYKYNTADGKYEKIINGQCHGIIQGKNEIYLVDDMVGIRVLDLNFKTKRIIELPDKSRPHGIAYSEERNSIYVNLSGFDAIAVINLDSNNIQSQISISDKFRKQNTAQHHINDICCYGDSLYVSMFSRSGNWKRGVYDGVILEIDIETGEVKWPVVQDLWFPHTPVIINGLLHYCDSMRGTVQNSTWKNIVKFNGFVRGIAHDGDFYYVGQSMHRHIDRITGVNENISLDTGIFIVEEASKVTKFYSTPTLTDINAVMILE